MERLVAHPALSPVDFIQRWKTADLSERAAAQAHFIDLCRILNEPAPHEVDPTGDAYTFEKGARKTGGGDGWADVWKRGFFGWEYKGKRKNLDTAYQQLQQYAPALENPPLLVVCDLERFRIHTNWTNTISRRVEFGLDDIRDPAVLANLKWVFAEPEKLRPDLTRESLTREAAAHFARLAKGLRARGFAPGRVAHFVNRMIFCMFAEDVDLLPGKMFSRLLSVAERNPDRFPAMTRELFAAMKSGGTVAWDAVPRFNGGLFDDDDTLPLEAAEIAEVAEAARLEWQDIDPSILGTLFEAGLDPDKRSQLGAHYTDRAKIDLIVDPVVRRPLLAEWEGVKARIADLQAKAEAARTPALRSRAGNEADAAYRGFLDRLRRFRVLDPACGSGNFLYVSLMTLKDIEMRVMLEAEALGLTRELPALGPEAVLGIEINPYAAELARVSVWIGEIQWMRRHGFGVTSSPILRSLDTIECRDALLDPDGSPAEWPEADVIVGNPPFLGAKRMISILGQGYTDMLRAAFRGQVSPFTDLVGYWVEKARALLSRGHVKRVGLVTTNSMNGGSNLPILKAVSESGRFFEVWSDEPWTADGTAVRVSLLCFEAASATSPCHLDGKDVGIIQPTLSAVSYDLSEACSLNENGSRIFVGIQKSGPFDVEGRLAREWLLLPLNPNGRPNSDVLRPLLNGIDVTRRSRDVWVIDFGVGGSEGSAALYEGPFAHVVNHVKPKRSMNTQEAARHLWWIHWRPRPEMRAALNGLDRAIITPEVSKHRIFIWASTQANFDKNLMVVARDDDTTFGMLHSRFHELWSLRLGTSLEDRPRYTPSTTFETFPFPEGLGPNVAAVAYADDMRAQAIAAAAAELDRLRRNWLNPADLVRIVPEVVPGFPDRILPKDEAAAAVLRKRTLTNLYNERPAWLANAHRALDEAVAAAYGWPADLDDDDVLRRLLDLNLSRASA